MTSSHLDAADVVGALVLQVLHQFVDGALELRACSGRTAQGGLGGIAFGEEVFEERVATEEHGARQIPKEQVIVFVDEAFDAVRHLRENGKLNACTTRH